MEAMSHASTFLRFPPPEISSPSYALVVLNQRLPRFAPLLWSHGELLIPFLPLSSPWDSVGVRIIDDSRLFFYFLCVCDQQSSVFLPMEGQTVCMMACPIYSLRQIRWKCDTGQGFIYQSFRNFCFRSSADLLVLQMNFNSYFRTRVVFWLAVL